MTIEDLRRKQLIECIPDVYNYSSLLYIGARPAEGTIFLKEFKKANYVIDLVEIFKSNCDAMRKTDYFDNVFCGSIMDFEIRKNYDVIMWYHGVEHVEKNTDVLNMFEGKYNKLLIFGCPYGVYNQSACYGNIYEQHVSDWYPEDFEGFKVNTIGKKDIPMNNILAWRGLDENNISRKKEIF